MKPGKHLPWGHPLMERLRNFVQLQVAQKRIHPLLLGNFDQVWSLCFRPAARTLQPKGHVDDIARNISLRHIRHCIERCMGVKYTETFENDPTMAPQIKGGFAAHTPVDGYRLPRTLTTLCWANGDLGRGFISCRGDTLTEKQRAEANKAGRLR